MHQERFPKKEVAEILSEWSKRAVVNCFRHNGIDIDLSKNPALNSSLDQCVNAVIGELFLIANEHYQDSSPSTQFSEPC